MMIGTVWKGGSRSPDAVAVDEDGDLLLDRRRRRNKHGKSISGSCLLC